MWSQYINVRLYFALSCTVAFMLMGCARESHQAVASDHVETYRSSYSGERATLVVGNFNNQSSYMQGLFSSDSDQLGNQAKTILKTHLQLTNRFNIVDRENLEQIKQEAKLRGEEQHLKGARYAVTGSVTEFGRKETGDRELFGLFGAGKTQVAYAKVSLNIVDVVTSEIVYSTQGAGEYVLSNREVIGFGSTASYDATLNGKVLNFAIMEAVNNLTTDLQNGVWNIKQ